MKRLVRIYFRTFWEIWNASQTFFLWFLLMTVFSAITPFIRLELTRQVTVALTERYEIGRFIEYVGFFILLLLVFELLNAGIRKLYALSQEKGRLTLQMKLTEKSCTLNYEDISSEAILNQKALAEQVMNQFGQILDGMSRIFSNLAVVSVIAVIITRVNLIIILTAALGIVLNAICSKRNTAAQFRRNRRDAPVLRKLNYYYDVFENFKYAKDIRGYQMGERFEPFLEEIQNERTRLTREYFRYSRWQGMLLATASVLLSVAIYFVLGYELLVAGKIGYPDFVYLSGLVFSFNGSISAIAAAFAEYKENAVALESYYAYKDIPTRYTRKEADMDRPAPQSIAFSGVTFRYPGSDHDALKDIDFKLVPGRKYAVVGENGAGKSTFIKLLLRMYLPTRGEILLNGRDAAEWNEEVYQDYFSAVFQDYSLFAMTLEENIALFHEDAHTSVSEAASMAGLGGKIGGLPDGMQTNLFRIFDENGIELSGGEGQKLAIARALYRDSEILVLDEPTAALDAIAEDGLYRMIHEHTESKTVFYVSHRLATTKFCDEILVFEKGRIVQRGSHEELVVQPGLYRELFEMQASAYRGELSGKGETI